MGACLKEDGLDILLRLDEVAQRQLGLRSSVERLDVAGVALQHLHSTGTCLRLLTPHKASAQEHLSCLQHGRPASHRCCQLHHQARASLPACKAVSSAAGHQCSSQPWQLLLRGAQQPWCAHLVTGRRSVLELLQLELRGRQVEVAAALDVLGGALVVQLVLAVVLQQLELQASRPLVSTSLKVRSDALAGSRFSLCWL